MSNLGVLGIIADQSWARSAARMKVAQLPIMFSNAHKIQLFAGT